MLIGQLLKMARVEGGVDVEQLSRFDLAAVVEEVSADAEYEARHRHCGVHFETRGACLVQGAREMIRGAIENVVRNAVRHTADHTTVEISIDHEEIAGRWLAVVRVRDRGPGVAAEALAGLFTPFHRVAHDASSHRNGTGLGLAITKRTFEVHHGQVRAANADGGGLLITLELPLQPQL